MLRSTGFRFALLYATLFSVSILVVFSVIYWGSSRYMARQLDAVISTELASLEQDYRRQGIAYLARVIAERAKGGGAGYYLLQDSAGNTMAGNLPKMSVAAGWQDLTLPENESENSGAARIRAQGIRLSDNFLLLVGQDAHQLQETRELIVRAFGWGMLVALGLAFIGGIVMSAGMLHRMDAINRITHEIIEGDLSRRIPTRGTDDDFDRLSAHLNSMLDRIQALMDGLKQVSNDIAHDLRTPLSRLRQRLEGARLKAKTVAEYETAMDKAITDMDTVLGVFSALLRITQIEAGARRSAFTEVDLSDIVETIIEVYAPLANEQQQQLSGRVAPGVMVHGDRELLMQMLANLVENALRHSPPRAKVEIALENPHAEPVVLINDNGPGIPEEARKKVFQRFFRLDSSRATPGSGLGLSLVAAVANVHRITINLDDNRPGLRVSLRFPSRSTH